MAPRRPTVRDAQTGCLNGRPETRQDVGAWARAQSDRGQVALDHGDKHAQATAPSKRAGHRLGERLLALEHQPQQRAPGQRDAQLVDPAS